MGYRSDVALVFPKENWEKILEEAKTDKAANTNKKYKSFEDLMEDAKVYDTPHSKILKFEFIKWYDSPGEESAIDFLNRMQKKYNGEILDVGEDLSIEHEYPESDDIPQRLIVDYTIVMDDVNISIYDKTNILEAIAKDYKKHDPKNYEKFVQSLETKYDYLKDCIEFKKLFY